MADPKINLPANERLNYREWNAPAKVLRGDRVIIEAQRVNAYLIGASSPVTGKNIYIQKLEDMAKRTDDPKAKIKYINTIRFPNHFGVIQPAKTEE